MSRRIPHGWNSYTVPRVVAAYKAMAEKVKYRPAAPSSGFGHVLLTETEAADPAVLDREANKYAWDYAVADSRIEGFGSKLGCPNGQEQMLFIYCVEAAYLCCMGGDSRPFIERLLELALSEVKTPTKFEDQAP